MPVGCDRFCLRNRWNVPDGLWKDGYPARFAREQLWASAVMTTGKGDGQTWNSHPNDNVKE